MEQGNGRRIVRYLLGELPEDEEQQLEEQFFVNDDYFERLMATEDELIDDYLRGHLSTLERERFEKKYLSSSRLREKINLAKALIDYIDGRIKTGSASPANLTFNPPTHGGDSLASEAYGRLNHGLRNYRASLSVIASVRAVILASLWFFMYRATFTGGSQAHGVFYLFGVLGGLYVVLEVATLIRATRDAYLAAADAESEIDPS